MDIKLNIILRPIEKISVNIFSGRIICMQNDKIADAKATFITGRKTSIKNDLTGRSIKPLTIINRKRNISIFPTMAIQKTVYAGKSSFKNIQQERILLSIKTRDKKIQSHS